MSAGLPGILSQTRLRLTNGTLRMIINDSITNMVGDLVEKRFRQLARALNAEIAFETKA